MSIKYPHNKTAKGALSRDFETKNNVIGDLYSNKIAI